MRVRGFRRQAKNEGGSGVGVRESKLTLGSKHGVIPRRNLLSDAMPVILRLLFAFALAGLVVAPLSKATWAQEFWLSEVRAGVLAHSIDEPGPGGAGANFTRWEDISFEVLFHSPQVDAFRWIGSPRPSIGANLNLGGRESLVRAGLTWHLPIMETGLFLEGTFGAALHNGLAAGAVPPARDLGCSLLFYESAAIGYEVTDRFNVVLSIEHASNANLCAANRGLTNAGVKFGYKF